MNNQFASPIKVSVIIPAHNAAETIAKTLESLLAQTYHAWEAIIVDDGSIDETKAVATSFAEKEHRIRILFQAQGGVCAARNAGIAIARFDWLLFLDADDWLAPAYLEKMTNRLLSDSTLDGVYCIAARISPEGTLFEEFLLPSGDMFHALARYATFPIHTCVIRRSLVEGVGGFDPSLRACEDWDLWQRIARTGARFGAVCEVLAFYRMKPGSASANALQMFSDGLRVLKQGHAPDARVKNPHQAYANGLPAEQLHHQIFYFLSWCAGLLIGYDNDARVLLNSLKEYHYPELNPHGVAQNIYRAALLPTCRIQTAWVDFWPKVERRIHEFLIALELHAQASGLAYRVRTALERMIVEHASTSHPLTIGTTHAIRVEVTRTISDLFPPTNVERLHCSVEFEGTAIGIVELPVCDGLVPGYVLSDAIAAEFAWQILGRFFERTIYSKLHIRRDQTGFSVWRGSLCLASALCEDEHVIRQKMHEYFGWTVFLQEIWGRQGWLQNRFYRTGLKTPLKGIGWRFILPENWSHFFPGKTIKQRSGENEWLTIEVCNDLPSIKVSRRVLTVIVTVGGIALGVVTMPVKRNIVRTQKLLAALTKACGFELCRAAVREGLLGRSVTEKPVSLRKRLAELKKARTPDKEADALLKEYPEFAFMSGYVPFPDRVLHESYRAILGRHAHDGVGTSASRRAMLPAAAAVDLIDAASATGEPAIPTPGTGKQHGSVIYIPELMWRPRASAAPEMVHAKEPSCTSKSHFEALFTARIDPWNYTSPYEQTKYEQTLALIPSTRIKNALELACAEGHFTVKLAPLVDNLLAADISRVALDRAAKRCAGMKNISFICLDMTQDPLPGSFDLIVCSEVLYFIDKVHDLEAVAHKLASALNSGGYLLMAHAHVVTDEPDKTGFDWNTVRFGAKVINDTFKRIRKLCLVKELWTPLYRIQLYERRPRAGIFFRRKIPEIVKLNYQPAPLLPKVEAAVRWRCGGHPRNSAHKTVVTDRLPILMYHRIAPPGKPSTARYQVTSESFEEQIRYLSDAGYYSVSLNDWHVALEKKTPLPGNAVMITFDDGYLDFLTCAWPLLKQYGFLATVFLVADHVGGSNKWDSVCGEAPLLRWEDIKKLLDDGVAFGSHSASHPCLTSLSPANIVREGARSRSILRRKLGLTVNAFAYPYGDTDHVVQHLIGACGYIYGLSSRPGMSGFHDPLLALPRIEITGTDRFQDFIDKLNVHPTQVTS